MRNLTDEELKTMKPIYTRAWDEGCFWCVVCQKMIPFKDVRSVGASVERGGWYCGYHDQQEKKDTKPEYIDDPLDVGKRYLYANRAETYFLPGEALIFPNLTDEEAEKLRQEFEKFIQTDCVRVIWRPQNDQKDTGKAKNG